jgi:uncharacterized membrane protein YphA (DoxX/SURF4 family)
MQIIAIIVQVLLGLAFLMAGGMKLANVKNSQEQRDRLGVAPWFWRLTGAIEVIGALLMFVGLGVHILALAGAALLGATMIGAFFTHIMRRDAFSHTFPTLVLLALAVVVIVAHWPVLTQIVL